MFESVYVIILNYNHLDDLKETVFSFLNQDYPNLHLVVSDNGSTDDSIPWLKQNQPSIKVLENGENLGWAEGNNVGIRYALKNNADYILLANNDLFFEDQSIISKLVASFDLIPKLGIIGPKENSYFNKTVTINEGWIMFPKSKYIFNKKRKTISNINIQGKYRIVDNVSGSFMLIKRALFKDLGLMDSKLFLYAEDTDFSLRAWGKDWISAIDAEQVIYHKISATSGNNSPLKLYYKTRNLIYLIRKHKNLQESHAFFTFKYYFDGIKLVAKIIFKYEFSGNRFNKLKAHIMGLWHGAIFKRMGKYY